jgi:septum formation protein
VPVSLLLQRARRSPSQGEAGGRWYGSPIAPRLILASASPARLRVLRQAGFDPEVVISGVSEQIGEIGTARAVVVLAERKGTAVAEQCPDSLVLSCDSMLDLDGSALGKPASPEEATVIWQRLSGHHGVLHTGHCLIDTRTDRRVSRLASTVVRFGTPSRDEISAYVASGEPLRVAGAFTIDGLAGPFVDGIEGDPSNVLGLSLPLFRRMLDEFGVSVTELWRVR